MKTGTPPPPRLSAKLTEDLNRIRHENAALTASQLENFRRDLSTIVTGALTTIEADTKAFQRWNELLWQKQRQIVTRTISLRRWMLLGGAALLAITLFVVTWTWSALIADLHRSATLEAVGLQLHRDPIGTFLILDPARIMPTTCSVQGRTMPCLQVEN